MYKKELERSVTNQRYPEKKVDNWTVAQNGVYVEHENRDKRRALKLLYSKNSRSDQTDIIERVGEARSTVDSVLKDMLIKRWYEEET